ncbi:MAG: hypothetical protein NVSMB5_14050 [Candidatus Velthaea sp.]
MGAFAALTIPLDLSRPGSGTLALAAAQSSAGSTGIRIDAARRELHMQLQLPGNITSLMGRLASAGFAIPPSIRVTVPVRSLGIPEKETDVAHMIDEMHATGHVRNAAIEGDRLTASIGPSSKGLYAIYINLIHSGLMAQDTPTLVALRGL